MRIYAVFLFMTMALSAIIGIDYGQQYTKAVLLAPGVQFEILLTEEARRKDLLGISIRPAKNEDIDRVYGTAAQSLCTRFPQYCVSGIKPLLGKAADDKEVQHYLSTHFGLKIINDEARNNSIKFDLGLTNQSFVFSAEEILAMSFKELKRRALNYLQENPIAKPIVDDVAVSVSPFITQEQRQAYIDALDIAGFKNILGLVDEGTAVATNYLTNKKFEQKEYDGKKRYNMIYDMGAGSTTATLFSITPFTNLSTGLELESVGYDESFGGLTLTQSVFDLLSEKLALAFGHDENFDLPPRAAARLLEAAEKAKIILSANNDYHVNLESLLDDKDFKTVVSREEFEEINIDNMNRITQPIIDALQNTGVSIKQLESVILAGGSSRVPFVQKHLSVLLGDDRIAKTVNADESCALGTTVKAFKEKTQFGSSKDFSIIDRAYHNYVINFNGQESTIFPKGTPADSTVRVDLGDLTESASIQLYEDGRFFKEYDFENISNKSSSLTCNDDKAYSKKIFATFTLDTSKIFNLVKVEVECIKQSKDGFFKNLLNGEKEPVEEEEEVELDSKNDTAVNATTKSRPSRKVLRPVSIHIPRPSYATVKPMPKPMKERVVKKLEFLDSKDQLKVDLDNTKNKLESACYELRGLIEKHEDEISHEIPVDEFRTKVSDTIEWLEFDSDDSSITEFESQIKLIELRKEEIKSVLKMAKTDLSMSGINDLYEKASSIVMQIQSKMLEFGSEISELRQKYNDEGFDFDKENDRIKVQLLTKGEDKMMMLDRSLAHYRELLTDLGEITQLNEKHFNKISKRDLFDKYEQISDSIVEMLAELLMLDESHKERVKLFETKFQKLVERRQQKEFKEKLKQEKAKAKAEKAEKAEAEKEEADFEFDTDSSAAEESTSTNTSSDASEETTEEFEHDEL